MSSTINRVILVGNLVKDPHLDKTENQNSVCNAIIATNSKDKVLYSDLVFWGKLGELFAQIAKKGSKIYIEGSLNQYIDNEIRKTEVVVADFVVLDRINEKTAQVIEDSVKDKYNC